MVAHLKNRERERGKVGKAEMKEGRESRERERGKVGEGRNEGRKGE